MNDRTFAEVNLDAIAHNIQQARRITSPQAKVMGVVKADGYGHGAYHVSKTLLDNGADMLGVAFVDEAVQLRKQGFDVPILLLGYTGVAEAENLLAYDITPTMFDCAVAQGFSDFASRSGKKMKIHIKIDTGMSRIGFVCNKYECTQKIKREILEIAKMPMLEIEGIFTHFSTADDPDSSYTLQQFDLFTELCEELEKEGLHIPLRHVCNSAATIRFPQMHLDLVRPGIILYGLAPFEEVGMDLIPAMEFKSTVVQLKELDMNTFVGYGNTFKTDRKTVLATIPTGYADGYFRSLSNRAYAYVNGHMAKIVGRICMDQCMLDVTDVKNIRIGDHVTLFGGPVPTGEIADLAGTIHYEIVCAVGKRVPRIYKRNDHVIDTVNLLERL